MNKDIDAQCADGAQFHVFTGLRRRLAPSLLIADRRGGLAASQLLESDAWRALPGPSECNRRLPRATTGEMIRGV